MSAPVHLSDYRPPDHLVRHADLTLRLDPQATRVAAALQIAPNPEGASLADLFLHGEGLRLNRIALDGRDLTPADYLLTEAGLTIPQSQLPEGPFRLETEVEIAPEANTALEGLYLSNGIFCTQCEAEGFRRITFYPDRPDVLATMTTRIESDLPVRLGNGDRVEEGAGYSVWHDPHPKPAYLFAVVAGDLTATRDAFTTMEGRDVALNIWTAARDADRTAYAMDALKRSMAWDERVYGRAYDLSIFNLVAVDDFNAGAMENKGLNIFNAALVLASPETATDADYAAIEGVVAHEYFHNWTGNRITCRDWFQLCLKEGLTVFRDQQFSADMRSAPVKRIEDVLTLRARQFREDAGPLAHPVRPETYVEINNFYTATVYEKGAELVGMLRRLMGADAYAAALDLYFRRHDGEACTVEDFLACFEDVGATDLSQFKRWYQQAGTPRVSVETSVAEGTVRMAFRQTTPPTPGQPLKEPVVIPLVFGLLAPDGTEILGDTLIRLDAPENTAEFDLGALAGAAGVPVPDRVIPSLNRGFSAPVILDGEVSAADRLVRLAADTDSFNRWEAGRTLLRDTLLADLGAPAIDRGALIDALGRAAANEDLDPAFRALVLALPAEADLAQAAADAGIVPDPSAIQAARKALAARIGGDLATTLEQLYTRHDPGAYRPDAAGAGKRALRNAALSLLTRAHGTERARAQFEGAANMTDRMAAFAILIANGDTDAAPAIEGAWRDNRQLMDKWFGIQIAQAPPDAALDRARALEGHALFDPKNPNRLRAVVGAFAANQAAFHDASGAGYAYLADWLMRLDAANPQTAARLSTAFAQWRRYDADRQDMILAQLGRIAGRTGLSPDLGEMVDRMRSG